MGNASGVASTASQFSNQVSQVATDNIHSTGNADGTLVLEADLAAAGAQFLTGQRKKKKKPKKPNATNQPPPQQSPQQPPQQSPQQSPLQPSASSESQTRAAQTGNSTLLGLSKAKASFDKQALLAAVIAFLVGLFLLFFLRGAQYGLAPVTNTDQ